MTDPDREGPPPDVRTALARFLRQRVELGSSALYLDAGSREALIARVDAGSALPGPGRTSSIRSPGAPERAPAGERKRAPGGPGEPAPDRPAPPAETRGPARPSGALPGKYDELQEVALACERCALAEGRANVVFGDGNPNARLMVVGEAPGANEDRTGVPFVGQAGKLLDLLLASVGLSRKESVYICNVIKCRPPSNRNPRPEEIEACAPYLRRQIEIVAPEVILAVGTFAAQLLTGEKAPLGKLRGKVYRHEGLPLIVTYHPAALLRNSGWTRSTWDDLQLLRRTLEGS